MLINRSQEGISFSALQRAEIAEMIVTLRVNERKTFRFSALQRAEIAEIRDRTASSGSKIWFQCSSTSRNC